MKRTFDWLMLGRDHDRGGTGSVALTPASSCFSALASRPAPPRRGADTARATSRKPRGVRRTRYARYAR